MDGKENENFRNLQPIHSLRVFVGCKLNKPFSEQMDTLISGLYELVHLIHLNTRLIKLVHEELAHH